MTNKSKNQIELYTLGKCKNEIIKLIEDDDSLDSLIRYGSNNSDDLKRGHLYDTLIIDLTQKITKTYITMDTSIKSTEGSRIKCVEITINIFSHLTLIKLTNEEERKFYSEGYYGNRIDIILDMLSRKLIGNQYFGIGELKLAPINPIKIIQPDVDYYGKVIRFETYIL